MEWNDNNPEVKFANKLKAQREGDAAFFDSLDSLVGLLLVRKESYEKSLDFNMKWGYEENIKGWKSAIAEVDELISLFRYIKND